jgi:hypothetical protein
MLAPCFDRRCHDTGERAEASTPTQAQEADMQMPLVTEVVRELTSVTPDTFLDGLGAADSGRPLHSPQLIARHVTHHISLIPTT